MKMPRSEAFQKRTLSIYSSMVKRFSEKRNKRGRIIRIGRKLPFGLEEFRYWAMLRLGGSPEGVTSCRYCKVPLTALNVSYDHICPIAQGGSLGLENLDDCCVDCQRLKGSLTEKTFIRLLEWLQYAGAGEEAMTAADGKEIRRRLKGGGGFFRHKAQMAKLRAEGDNHAAQDTLGVF